MKIYSVKNIKNITIAVVFLSSQLIFAEPTKSEARAVYEVDELHKASRQAIDNYFGKISDLRKEIDNDEKRVAALNSQQEKLMREHNCDKSEAAKLLCAANIDLLKKLKALEKEKVDLTDKTVKTKAQSKIYVDAVDKDIIDLIAILDEADKRRMEIFKNLGKAGPSGRGKPQVSDNNKKPNEASAPPKTSVTGPASTEAAPAIGGVSESPVGASAAPAIDFARMYEHLAPSYMTPEVAAGVVTATVDSIINRAAVAKANSIRIEAMMLMNEFETLEDKLETTDKTLDAIEENIDKAILGAYLKDKIGQLMNSQLICKARQRCSVTDPTEIPASALDEIFPESSKSSRSEHYKKVNKKDPINRTPAPSTPQAPAEGLE